MHPRDEIPDRARVGFGHLPLAFETGLLDLTTGEPLPWRTTGILLNEHIADDGPTGKAPEELDWTDAQRQKRAVAGYWQPWKPKLDRKTRRNAAMTTAQEADDSPALTARRPR